MPEQQNLDDAEWNEERREMEAERRRWQKVGER